MERVWGETPMHMIEEAEQRTLCASLVSGAIFLEAVEEEAGKSLKQGSDVI